MSFAATTAAQAPLFSPVSATRIGLTERQKNTLDLLRGGLDVEAVEIVRADVSAMSSARVMYLALPGEAFVLEMISTRRQPSGVLSRTGQCDTSQIPTAGNALNTFATRNGMMTGSVQRGAYLD